MVEAITGLRRSVGGTAQLAGQDFTHWSVRERREHGLGYVPGDRQKYGLVLGFPISDNLILTQYYNSPFARGIQREDSAIEKWARETINEFDIRTPSWAVPAGTLSGGNQQKVIVAREFSRDLKALVLDQPTRGLDVGSIEFIHKQVIRKREAGTAVLLVSAELDEVLELSDRIAVMYRGRIVAVVDGRTANKEEIGLLMATGGRAQAEASPAGPSDPPGTDPDTSMRGTTT
jgi:simple sugar transport system ATP-binding protein